MIDELWFECELFEGMRMAEYCRTDKSVISLQRTARYRRFDQVYAEITNSVDIWKLLVIHDK